jgi:hypothetical protein
MNSLDHRNHETLLEIRRKITETNQAFKGLRIACPLCKRGPRQGAEFDLATAHQELHSRGFVFKRSHPIEQLCKTCTESDRMKKRREAHPKVLVRRHNPAQRTTL